MNRVSKVLSFPKSLIKNRELLWKLMKRQVSGRYRGSILGWGWSLITPLLMLAVYTFVFSQVFKARWGDLDESGPLGFAINLFAGLIAFQVFAETANESTSLILSNTNLVKKVIFPLEILSVVSVGTALFHACTSLTVLAIFELISIHTIPMSIIWLPLAWLPLISGCIALSWCLSALCVYLRDLAPIISVATNLLMFMSAVFYPLEALPKQWQPFLSMNPLTMIIEQTRLVCVTGQAPSMAYLGWGSLIGLASCEIAYRAFKKASRGFADVL